MRRTCQYLACPGWTGGPPEGHRWARGQAAEKKLSAAPGVYVTGGQARPGRETAAFLRPEYGPAGPRWLLGFRPGLRARRGDAGSSQPVIFLILVRCTLASAGLSYSLPCLWLGLWRAVGPRAPPRHRRGPAARVT